MSMSAASDSADRDSLQASGCRGGEPCSAFDHTDLRRLRLLVHDTATDHLRGHDGRPDPIRAERVEDFVTAVSEIATNAVMHAGGGGRIRFWLDQDALICEISDSGPGLADPTAGTSPPVASPRGGYGLWMARTLCPDLALTTTPAGTTVRMRLNR
jgi:two-component sensor histidine kinase